MSTRRAKFVCLAKRCCLKMVAAEAVVVESMRRSQRLPQNRRVKRARKKCKLRPHKLLLPPSIRKKIILVTEWKVRRPRRAPIVTNAAHAVVADVLTVAANANRAVAVAEVAAATEAISIAA